MGAFLLAPLVGQAQVGQASFWKRLTGGILVPTVAGDQLGDASHRIDVFADTLDAGSLAVGGVVGGDHTVSGNQFVYGSGGVTAVKFTATSTAEGLNVTGRGVFGGVVTTTAGLVPATAGGANVGSALFPYSGIYATGTAVLGGALTVTNGTGAGADRVQVGYEQAPAKVAGDTYLSTAPLNLYAASTGFVDAFTMTAGGNGADGACFSAKNLGGILGRQCQTSSPLTYWIMGNTLAFNTGSTVPYATANVDMIIRSNNVGIGLANTATPSTKLEVAGTVSSTASITGAGTVGAPSRSFSGDTDTGSYNPSANVYSIAAGGVNQVNVDNNGITLKASYAAAAGTDGVGLAFGDSIRALRMLSLNGGDFEFRNWYLNWRYENSFNGSNRRYVAFDGGTMRVAISDSAGLDSYHPATALEVKGTGVSTTQMVVSGNTTSSRAYIGTLTVGSCTGCGGGGGSSASDWTLSGTDVTLTTTTNRVLIGMTSSGSGEKLGVAGTVSSTGMQVNGNLAVTATSTLANGIQPQTTGAGSVGTASRHYGVGYIDDFNATTGTFSALATALRFIATGDGDYGNAAIGWGEDGFSHTAGNVVTVAGGGYVTVASQTGFNSYVSIKPAYNNSLSLGAWDFAFSNLYVSSTAYMADLYANNVTSTGTIHAEHLDSTGDSRVGGLLTVSGFNGTGDGSFNGEFSAATTTISGPFTQNGYGNNQFNATTTFQGDTVFNGSGTSTFNGGVNFMDWTKLTVAGQGVCLSDGSHCSGDSNWSFNAGDGVNGSVQMTSSTALLRTGAISMTASSSRMALTMRNENLSGTVGININNFDGNNDLFNMEFTGPESGDTPPNLSLWSFSPTTTNVLFMPQNDGAPEPWMGFSNVTHYVDIYSGLVIQPFSFGAIGAGSDYSAILQHNHASTTLDFADLTTAGTQSLTITVPGASVGDDCSMGDDGVLFARTDEIYMCRVSATDTIAIKRACVNAAGCGDPSAALVGASYTKHSY